MIARLILAIHDARAWTIGVRDSATLRLVERTLASMCPCGCGRIDEHEPGVDA